MQLSYQLEKEDYVTHRLFVNSQDSAFKRRRQAFHHLFVLFIFYLLVLFLGKDLEILMLLLMAVWIIVPGYFLIKAYTKWVDRYNCRKKVEKDLSEIFGLNSQLQFSDDNVSIKDELSESKILYSALRAINETGGFYYLNLKSFQSIIIPKQYIADKKDFEQLIQSITSQYQIPHNQYLDWKWK